MKIESPAFTDAYYNEVIGGYFERERQEIIARLRRIADDTDALVPSLPATGTSDDPDWNAVETLAHISISAQFFGWVIHEVAKEHDIGERMLGLMNLRDPSMVDAVRQEPADLARQLRDGLERTIAFLEKTGIDELRNTIAFAGRQLSAWDFTRVSVVQHLEDHVEQMRAAAGG